MPRTATRQPARRQIQSIRRGRALRVALPALGLLGVVVAVALLRHHDGSVGQPTFSPAEHQVTYEVAGTGTAREITYWVGTAAPVSLHEVGLPWQTTEKVTAGVGGEVVNLDSANPGVGRTSPSVAAPLVCRILVDGKTTAQRTSTDGYSDTSCSAPLYAERR